MRLSISLLVAGAALGASGPTPADAPSALDNLLTVTEGIYSGGEPVGDAGFAALQALGVKTIVSVDSLRPDVEAAKAVGIRYVHIPIGYDGVPRGAQAALARVVAECERPIYMHCHHGKHRGPAAAAIALQLATGCGPREATALLERAGTSRGYPGLWRDVQQFDPAALTAIEATLYESAPLAPMGEAMAHIDRHWDVLQASRENAWHPLPDHPDATPAQTARLLAELFRELIRSEGPEWEPAFAEAMQESERLAEDLLAAIESSDRPKANQYLTQLGQSCRSCHTAYRNAAALE